MTEVKEWDGNHRMMWVWNEIDHVEKKRKVVFIGDSETNIHPVISVCDEDKPVPDDVLVRKDTDQEWVPPTKVLTEVDK